MEYEKATATLKSLLEKKSLSEDEKEAIMTAIGVLNMGAHARSRIKSLKAKRDKSTEW